MEIKRIDHVSGKGSYIVQTKFGPKFPSVTLFGPATLGECEQFVRDAPIYEQTQR